MSKKSWCRVSDPGGCRLGGIDDRRVVMGDLVGERETGDFGGRREIWWDMDQTVWQRDLDPSYVVAKEVVMSDGREVKSWC